jgi:hypothetical protein
LLRKPKPIPVGVGSPVVVASCRCGSLKSKDHLINHCKKMDLMKDFPKPSHLLGYQLSFSASKPLMELFSGVFHPILVFQAKLTYKAVRCCLSNVFFAITILLKAQATNRR